MENQDEKKSFRIPIYDPTKDLSQAPKPGTKRGKGYKPLLENEIKEAQSKARSAMEAARILGVSYNTYKKYATQYRLFDVLKNPKGKGIPKGNNIKRGKYALDDLIKGKYPNYPVYKLKSRLLKNGYKLEQCENCGFCEHRITDHKVPLVLTFKDGNKQNHMWDNLEMLCFNCYFLTVGNLSGPKNLYDY